MKLIKLRLGMAALLFAAGFAIVSCSKKDVANTILPDTDISGTTDNNTSESASKDIVNIGAESIDGESLSTYKLSSNTGEPSVLSGVSGTVTIVPNLPNKTVTVTFTSFVGYDGNTRNGTLIYNWSGSASGAAYFKDAGFDVTVATTTTNPYTIYNTTLGGTYTVTINKKHIRNLGIITTAGSSGTKLTWLDTSNINIVKPYNGGTITWNCVRNTILVNTNAITYNGVSVAASYTPGQFIDWTHAVIGFTGNASGVSAAGSSYTSNITSRVDYNFNCSPYNSFMFYHPPVAGSIDFTPQGKTTRNINYGIGTCDDTYTVTIGSYSIALNVL
jgi:hypothetical protein